MLDKWSRTLLAVCCSIILTQGQKGIVPFKFCERHYVVLHEYATNATTNDSMFVKAVIFRSLIWKDSSLQTNCNNSALTLVTERSISRPPGKVKVFYNITVTVKESYRYNYSFLNNTNLGGAVEDCYSHVTSFVRKQHGFRNALTLNISGTEVRPQPLLTPESMQCDENTQAMCPLGSRKVNRTCVCVPGTSLDVKMTKCASCPENTYQAELAQVSCEPCPPQTSTREQTGSTSSSDCMIDCSKGHYFDNRTKTCKVCPKDEYQDIPGSTRCEPCPDGKTTPGSGTDDVSGCKKSDNTLAIAMSVAAVIVLVLIAVIAVIIIRNRRRKQLLRSIFQKNFEECHQEFRNPYFRDSSDEEHEAEHCPTLGRLESEVVARNLEIPRDYIKLTNQRLGRGNFGEVHQILVQRPEESEMLCAAKMARGSRVSMSDMLDELDIHLKLEKHPNVVNLIGVCSSSDGPFYLIVEYCDNKALNDFLKEHKPLPQYVNRSGTQALSLEWRRRRILEVCSGMKFLSSNKIVHRDLAARNVLLDHNMVAKVADFGMAKDIYVKSYYKQHREGSFPLRWMAIEAIQELTFNEKTDVWSFGVLIWEIFTDVTVKTKGKLPYYSIFSDEKVAQYIMSGKKLKRPSNCPKYMYRIMSKCWNEKDYNRPGFRELYDELNKTIQENDICSNERRKSKGSLKKRFSETKKSMKRRLSRRSSNNSQEFLGGESSIATPENSHRSIDRQDPQDIRNVDNFLELESVDEDLRDTSEAEGEDGNDHGPTSSSTDLEDGIKDNKSEIKGVISTAGLGNPDTKEPSEQGHEVKGKEDVENVGHLNNGSEELKNEDTSNKVIDNNHEKENIQTFGDDTCVDGKRAEKDVELQQTPKTNEKLKNVSGLKQEDFQDVVSEHENESDRMSPELRSSILELNDMLGILNRGLSN